jgi:hypothetical protein
MITAAEQHQQHHQPFESGQAVGHIQNLKKLYTLPAVVVFGLR